jgi:hypothetical protein
VHHNFPLLSNDRELQLFLFSFPLSSFSVSALEPQEPEPTSKPAVVLRPGRLEATPASLKSILAKMGLGFD